MFYSVDVQSALLHVSCRENGSSCSADANPRALQTCVHISVLTFPSVAAGKSFVHSFPLLSMIVFEVCCWWRFFFHFVLFHFLNGEEVSWKFVPWPHSDSFCCFSALGWTQSLRGRGCYFSLASDISFHHLWWTRYKHYGFQKPIKPDNYSNLENLVKSKHPLVS